MRRPLLLAVAVLGLFAASAFGAIYFLTLDGPSQGPAAPPVAAAPLPPADPILAASLALAQGAPLPFAPPPPPPVVEQVAVPRYQPPEGTWESIPAQARPGALGPAGTAIGRDLIELQEQLGTCFDPAVAARYGGTRITETMDLVKREDIGETILMLQIEASGRTARIVDAPVEVRGNADEPTIACAQRILRGRTVKVAEAKPGRSRLIFHLHP
jgi:hypothetical protein